MIGNRQIRRIIVLAICILLPALYGWGQNVASHKAKQKGKATYYSRRATGARTSSGQRLHHDSLTCAHRTYPFGTRLKVTNLSNNKYTIVTVTDRGPYSKGKIIDLTYRAAKEIGMLSQGIAMVEIEVYEEVLTPLETKRKKYVPMEFDFVEFEDDDSVHIDVIHPSWQQKRQQTNQSKRNHKGEKQ